MNDKELEKYLENVNQKKILEEQINRYNINYDMNNYFLNTGHILYKYYFMFYILCFILYNY